MKYDAIIEKKGNEYELIIPSKNQGNPLLNAIKSIDLKHLKTPVTYSGDATIYFCLNFLSLDTFSIDESCLYEKDPDPEGSHKRKVKNAFLLDDFTSINPQKNHFRPYIPIIHVSGQDFFSPALQASNAFILPRYIKYLDSSIWNYYVPYQKADSHQSFEQRFRETLSEIIEHTLLGVYTINNAREYADLHARQAKESYMSGVGAHTKNVSPYLFHSEDDMKQLSVSPTNAASSPLAKIDTFLNQKGFHWRLLIIDDFVRQPLKTYPQGGSRLNKTDIIVNILSKRFDLHTKPFSSLTGTVELYRPGANTASFSIDRAETLQEAIDKLTHTCYDIILLDYLLNYKDALHREYSYELLDKIIKEEALHKKALPFKKFWIFHISSFRSAIQERLQEKGYAYHGDHWDIAQGACPLNTPRLFEYRLYSFMYRQIKSLSLSMKDMAPMGEIFTVTELLEKLANPSGNSPSIVTTPQLIGHFRHNFQAFLKLKEWYKDLHKELEIFENTADQSVLTRSIYTDVDKFDNAFWEHLLHLAHLIAYGSGPQWGEMSEELYFLGEDLPQACRQSIKAHIENLRTVYN